MDTTARFVRGFSAMAAVGIGLAGTVAGPQTARAADPQSLAVELNKLETYDKGCRSYVVINNASDLNYQSVKLDLVLFQPDGIIARRFAVDLAPIKPTKTTVKLFDIEGLACDKIASLLVNDVLECRSDAGPVADCLSHMALTSVAGAPLTKYIKR